MLIQDDALEIIVWNMVTILLCMLSSRPNVLTHWGLVLPFCIGDLGQHWFRWWFVAWWHQAIIWTSDDLSLKVSCVEISQVLMNLIRNMCLVHFEITATSPRAQWVNNCVLSTGEIPLLIKNRIEIQNDIFVPDLNSCSQDISSHRNKWTGRSSSGRFYCIYLIMLHNDSFWSCMIEYVMLEISSGWGWGWGWGVCIMSGVG